MIKLITCAWRNLWRNRRRTLITASSVFFGVIFSIAMTSFQTGSLQNIVDNMVRFYSGYLQVQAPGYFGNPGINEGFRMDPQLEKLLSRSEHISQYAFRLESFALVSSGMVSQGAMVLGMDPIREDSITGISKRITEGMYLSPLDEGVVLGEILASNLGVSTGDTLILLGQGYHGVTAAALFPVRGILHFPSPEMSRQFLIMDLGRAQKFYAADSLLTSAVVLLDHMDQLENTIEVLTAALGEKYRVIDWQELQPALVQFVDGKRSSGKIFISILFLIIGFGMLGTVIMMVTERRREMGVMIALGMRKTRIFLILLVESVWVGILGVVAGVAVGYPVVSLFAAHPIPMTGEIANTFIDLGFEPVMAVSNDAFVFIHPALTVCALCLLISVFPALMIRRLKAVHALRT